MGRVNKRCRRMLELAQKQNEVQDDTSVPKYRRVYQKVTTKANKVSEPSSSRIKILEDITICPPTVATTSEGIVYQNATANCDVTVSEPSSSSINILDDITTCAPTLAATAERSDCFKDLSVTPKRRKIERIAREENNDSTIFVSPSSRQTFQILQTVRVPETPSTDHNFNTSKCASPYQNNKNLNLSSTVSRCSSVSDLSCAQYLTCPLNDQQVSEILSMPKEDEETSQITPIEPTTSDSYTIEPEIPQAASIEPSNSDSNTNEPEISQVPNVTLTLAASCTKESEGSQQATSIEPNSSNNLIKNDGVSENIPDPVCPVAPSTLSNNDIENQSVEPINTESSKGTSTRSVPQNTLEDIISDDTSNDEDYTPETDSSDSSLSDCSDSSSENENALDENVENSDILSECDDIG
ncbi:uncharacterized protein, partial [Choristoneura fumiferana]|uniref:uncharacterized protein n=1 Tax=Choristoneura fumiferana TaxID=7141 RepID=UPI003D15EB7D